MGKLKDAAIRQQELETAFKQWEEEIEHLATLDKESLIAEILKMQRENRALRKELKKAL